MPVFVLIYKTIIGLVRLLSGQVFSENNHLVESALLHSMHWQTGSYHSSELIKFQSVLQSNSSIFFLQVIKPLV